MPARGLRTTIQNAAIVQGNLEIRWADGHTSQFHPIWLRHQCECDHCGTSLDAVRGLRLHHIPEDITPAEMSLTDTGVDITWSHDAHRSSYAARWLRDHCYSETERQKRKHRPLLWDASIADDVPVADFCAAREDPQARLDLLQSVCDFGFCKISNAPTEASQASQLIELVGEQRQTHFGTYRLSRKKAVDNVGDTTRPLDPHIDETYRLSHVGITVFQVLRPSSNGGESTLVDGFEAVRRLRESSPEDFDLLSRLPITSQRYDQAHSGDRDPKWYISRLPLIRLDADGEVCAVHLNERQIAPLDLPPEMIAPCYRAMRRVFETVYLDELRLTFKLDAGEGLIFDNQRVLHGRTGFVAEQPQRSVLTSSVDIEEFHSTLRLLQDSLGYEGPQIAYSQGMAS